MWPMSSLFKFSSANDWTLILSAISSRILGVHMIVSTGYFLLVLTKNQSVDKSALCMLISIWMKVVKVTLI